MNMAIVANTHLSHRPWYLHMSNGIELSSGHRLAGTVGMSGKALFVHVKVVLKRYQI